MNRLSLSYSILTLFRTLLDGKIVEYLWGCRKCYSAFESEESLESHIAKDHQGKVVNFNGGVGGGKNILVTSVKDCRCVFDQFAHS